MADPRFRGQRRDIATALNGHKRTLYETAKALGRRSGDIQKTLRQMHSEGILAAGDPEPTRGTEFWLDEAFVEALEDSLRAEAPAGLLGQGQELLYVRSPNQTRLAFVLSRSELTGAISWSLRLGADSEMLLAIAAEAAEAQIDALHSALEAAGATVSRWRTATPIDAESMRLNFVAAQEAAQLIGGQVQ